MKYKLYLFHCIMCLLYLIAIRQWTIVSHSHVAINGVYSSLINFKWELEQPLFNLTAKKGNRRFVVVTCSIHSSTVAYMFYAPLVAAAWQRIGYHVIVVFVGDFQLEKALTHRFILTNRFLQTMGAVVLEIQCNASYATKISQLIRVFSGTLPDYIADDNDSILTTDSDLIPIDGMQYKSENDDEGFLINSYCCGNFVRRGKKYRMLPLSHISLKKKTWRALLMESVQRAELLSTNKSLSLLSKEAPFSSDTVDLYARHEFKDLYTRKMTKGDSSWYMDQILCSMLLFDYLEKHPRLALTERNLTERLDRNWGIAAWNRVDFKKFGSAHLPHDKIFIPHYWDTLKKLLGFLFTDSQVKLFNMYYQTYKALNNF